MKGQVKPKVSIVAISYNHERYIRQALDSFLNQKANFEFEIIVGDDCSTDNTPSIIKEYAEKYPNLVKPILRTSNVGISRNFSDTMSKARGKYIALCECDDFWTDPNKIQIQADFLDGNPQSSFCFHPVNVFFEGKKEKEIIFPDKKDPKDLNLEELLKQNFIQTNSVMYRKQNHTDIPDGILPVDWYLHLYNAQFGEIGYIDKVMATYRRHEGGIWWSDNAEEFWRKNGMKHLAMHQAIVEIYGSKKEYQDALYEPILRAFLAIANLKSQSDHNQLLANAFEKYPAMAAEFLKRFLAYEETQIKDRDKLISSHDAHIKKLEAIIKKQSEDIQMLNAALEDVTKSKVWKLATALRGVRSNSNKK
ncbi:MAG: putative sugar transferase [Candidatus Saccharibacteria bacterium]|nr:putative sugar transferase [Candidatus Saccharibacteria bacterium]